MTVVQHSMMPDMLDRRLPDLPKLMTEAARPHQRIYRTMSRIALDVHGPYSLAPEVQRGILTLGMLALGAAALGWAVWFHLSVQVLPYDDAYITFRYVRNLRDGLGPVYNPAERVFGCSSPLYMLWLAGWSLLARDIDIPDLAVRTNAILMIATSVAAFLLVRRYLTPGDPSRSDDGTVVTRRRGLSGFPIALGEMASRFGPSRASRKDAASLRPTVWAALAAAGIAANPKLLAISAGGMEPFLFIALAIFALLAASCRRPMIAGLLAGLAALARPEGLLLVPVLALMFMRGSRPQSGERDAECEATPATPTSPWRTMLRQPGLLKCALAFALPFAAWHVFAWVYFGTPVPHSVIAKARPVYPLPAGYALIGTLRDLGSWLVGGHLTAMPPLVIAAMGAVGLLSLSIYRNYRKSNRRSLGAYAPAAIALGLVALYAAGNPLVFEWYTPPLLVMSTLAAVVVVADATDAASSRRALHLSLTAIAAAWLMLVSFPARTTPQGPQLAGPYAIERDPERLRIPQYQLAMQRLDPLLTPASTIAAPEIGAIGYATDAKILDPCGLVSPQALPFLPVPPGQRESPLTGAISVDFVRATNPDWVITLRTFAHKSLLPSEWFHARYERWGAVPLLHELWGSREVLIYRRRTTAIP